MVGDGWNGGALEEGCEGVDGGSFEGVDDAMGEGFVGAALFGDVEKEVLLEGVREVLWETDFVTDVWAEEGGVEKD